MFKIKSFLIIFLFINLTYSQNNVSKVIFEHFLINGNPKYPKTEIHIQVVNNVVWKDVILNNEIIVGNIKIEKNTLNILQNGESKSIRFNKSDKSRPNDYFTFEKFPEDRKEILGYDCYKIKMRRDFKINQSSFHTLYEMYVTEKIDLPMEALIENTKEYTGFFPLEISLIEGGWTNGTKEIFQVVYIE